MNPIKTILDEFEGSNRKPKPFKGKVKGFLNINCKGKEVSLADVGKNFRDKVRRQFKDIDDDVSLESITKSDKKPHSEFDKFVLSSMSLSDGTDPN